MQSQEAPKSNVVSLFEVRKKSQIAGASEKAEEAQPCPTESFSEVMERNLKNQARLAKERADANKSVLKSYRIKH